VPKNRSKGRASKEAKFDIAHDVLSFLDVFRFMDGKKSGVNFIKVLQSAFAKPDTRSEKNAVKPSVFMHFWDLRVCAKASSKTLLKSTPDLTLSLCQKGFRLSSMPKKGLNSVQPKP